MTVVKVQKPLSGAPLWLVYDKYKARLWHAESSELPRSVLNVFESAPAGAGRFKQYFDDAVWDADNRIWLLDNVKPVTRRLIW